VVSLLRRKPKFGSAEDLSGDLLGGGQFAPPMTEFFERFFQVNLLRILYSEQNSISLEYSKFDRDTQNTLPQDRIFLIYSALHEMCKMHDENRKNSARKFV
jgi:hypothetical protein